jgi:hypothetical protein
VRVVEVVEHSKAVLLDQAALVVVAMLVRLAQTMLVRMERQIREAVVVVRLTKTLFLLVAQAALVWLSSKCQIPSLQPSQAV